MPSADTFHLRSDHRDSESNKPPSFRVPKQRSLLVWIVDVGDKRVAPGDGYDRQYDPEKSGSGAFGWGASQRAFGPEWVGDKVTRFRVHRQPTRSVLSFGFASAVVCHCIFEGAPGPPHASARA